MKLPIRLRPVNLTCLALLATSACIGPIVGQAEFTRDPRAVRRGRLLGPFNGRIVDADSDKPIEGALVWVSWTFSRGIGSPAPLATRVREVRSGPDGQYRIAVPRGLPGGSSVRLSALSFVVYKRGYVAYRHDWRFGQKRRRRRDFAQLYNVVRLSRWSSELSHAAHLLFIGGDGSLRAEAQAELEGAARELSSEGVTLPTGKGPLEGATSLRRTVAQRLLDSDLVRRITGFTGILRGGALEGGGDATSSWHLRAVDRPERYDLALRFWRLEGASLQAKLAQLRQSLPGNSPRPAPGKGAFFVKQGEILGVAFSLPNRSAVVLLTCGAGQCPDEQTALRLGAALEKRLQEILPAPSNEKGGTR